MKLNFKKMIPTIGALTLLIALTPVTYQRDVQLKMADDDLQQLMAPPVVTSPFNPQYPLNQVPNTSIQNISKMTHLDSFVTSYQTSGKGQTIAIIDSGVDVGVNQLQDQEDHTPKVTQYYDLTKEGYLTSQATSRHQTQISLDGQIYRIGQIPNALSQYRLAVLAIDDILPQGLTSTHQSIPVLITASTKKGYDTIYIDTNMDMNFSDEMPITSYNDAHQYASVSVADYTLNLALTQLERNGSNLQLSSDFLGHGTFLAGIIAADSPDYQGLAPDSQLVAIKIFDRQGQSSQERLAKALILAAQQKVDIINLSLSLPSNEEITPALKEALDQVRNANIPIVAAAGNYGGGLYSTAFPANQPQIISTGSYIDPAMWQIDQLLYLEQPFISSFSSRGPNIQYQQAGIFPTLASPGAATSIVPAWHSEQYMYDEGTSISSAVTTAIIAHLNQYAQQHQIPHTPQHLTNALAVNATMLNLPNTDQGYGLINLTNIAQTLGQQSKIFYHSPYTTPKVLYTNQPNQNQFQLTISNPSSQNRTIHWQSDAAWVQVPQQITIPANQSINMTIATSQSPEPGHYSTMIHGTLAGDTIATLHIPINIIQSFPATNEPINIEIDIPTGQSKNIFIQVPEKTHLLNAQIDLDTLNPDNVNETIIPMGRCQMTLYDPTGKLISQTPYIGASYSSPSTTAKTLAVDPIPGTWQLVITSSDRLTMYNHFSTQGKVTIKTSITQ